MPESHRERLVREHNETAARLREILDRAEAENRDLTAEERTNVDKANTRLDEIEADSKRLDRSASRNEPDYSGVIPTGGGQPADPDGGRSEEQTAAEYRDAYSAYLRDGLGQDAGLTQRQRELLNANRVESRALGQGTPQAGGFLVPPEHRDQVVEVMQSFGGMLAYCNVITTATGAPMSWPISDDTQNEGIEIAENTQIGEQDVTFDTRDIGAHIYTSKIVRVPWSLQQDTAFDLDGFLIRKFGERLGRIYARRLLTGSGNGQPLGLFASSRVGQAGGLKVGATTPTGATASMRLDDFIELEHSVDPAYRNNGRARFGMSDGALKMARMLKDEDGRPLWVPIPAPGFAPTINGYPYFVDNSMAAPAPDGIGAAFGDFFAGMLVRQVQGFQAVRLTERYADFMQTGYFAYSRMDAAPDDPNALAAMRFGAAA